MSNSSRSVNPESFYKGCGSLNKVHSGIGKNPLSLEYKSAIYALDHTLV